MKERAYIFGDNLLGVLSEPANTQVSDLQCILLLNAGMVHKIGPNRLYVKLARKLVDSGYKTFRFDFSGIGDSPVSCANAGSFEAAATKNTIDAMDFLFATQGIKEFILMGICSGADVSFLTGIADARVTGNILVNGYLNETQDQNFSGEDVTRSITFRYYRKNLFNLARWKKVFSGKSNLFSKQNFINPFKLVLNTTHIPIFKPQKNKQLENSLFENTWEELIKKGTKVLLVYSEGSEAFEVFRIALKNRLEPYIRTNRLDLITIKDVDHVYTPIWSQNYLIDIVEKKVKEWNNRNNSVPLFKN